MVEVKDSYSLDYGEGYSDKLVRVERILKEKGRERRKRKRKFVCLNARINRKFPPQPINRERYPIFVRFIITNHDR
ncbi:MAG: hypothetical protein ABSE39_01650 [Candidatus Bathyarchaeia archaeon]